MKRGEPSVRPEINVNPSDTKDQRKRLIIHALARLKDDHSNHEPENQEIGAFGGFYADILERGVKSTPFYYLTYPQPPKKSVMFTVMERAVSAVDQKAMPFIQLVAR
jgi:hypothetical protein